MEPTVLDRLLEIGALFQRDMAREYAGSPLTPARMRVLWVLHHTGPVTQHALAEHLEMTPRGVSGLIDVLAESGYVRRAPHPTDRRATLVALTPVAAELLDETARSHAELTATLLDAVAPADREPLQRGVDAIAERLRGMVEDAARPGGSA